MRERQGSSETPEARGPRQDTKGDHPKAPEPVIGMEDERGDSKFTLMSADVEEKILQGKMLTLWILEGQGI